MIRVGVDVGTAGQQVLVHTVPSTTADQREAVVRGVVELCQMAEVAGKHNEFLWRFIRDKIRVPGPVMGDLGAQIASAELGVRRFGALLTRYGVATVKQCCAQLMDHSEAMMRRAIAAIPDGYCSVQGFLDDDGHNREADSVGACDRARTR